MSDCVDRRDFLKCAGLCMLAGLPVRLIASTQAGTEKRYPIPPTDSVNIDRAAQVIVARADGHVFAFNLSCPHQNAAVKWLPSDHRFQCTKHDSKYTPEGVYTSGRATRNMDRLPIRRDGDSVLVDTSKMFQSDKDPAGWKAAEVAV
jgi:Rieske Fe-S protein